jgi:integral membrane sensor domain MASE1
MVLLIYALCSLTALACAVLLLLGARRTDSRMLFWSGLCFAGLTLTNVLVLADHYLFGEIDLSQLRLGIALVAIALLLYGLIFEER